MDRNAVPDSINLKALIATCALLLSGHTVLAEVPVRPVLVGIYAQDYDATVSWYSENFGFETVKEVTNENANIKIGFLNNGAFELEIYSDIKPAAGSERLKRDRFGMPSQGFVKLSLEAEDLRGLASALRANDVTFVREIKESDRKRGQRWFMVEDPDGNLIQVFGPTPGI